MRIGKMSDHRLGAGQDAKRDDGGDDDDGDDDGRQERSKRRTGRWKCRWAWWGQRRRRKTKSQRW